MPMNLLAQSRPPLPTGRSQFGLKAVRRRASYGFTLLEILVAMLVAALGILGVVAMNLASIRMQADSANRAQAGLYAQDILDCMRANKTQAVDGLYDRKLGAPRPEPTGSAPLAKRDLSTWLTNLQRELPSGDAEVSVSSGGDVSVTIQWFERQNRGSVAGNVLFTFSSSL